MEIRLSDRFTYKKLLRFTFPSIVMMIFTSIYGVVDGFFVSNFAGKTAFAAVNFIMPFLMVLGAVGFMFGTGGGALIAKTLGEGDREKAKRLFSLFVYTSAAIGIVIASLGIIFIRPIASALGAEGRMLDDAVLYGRIILAALPAFMLQLEFQSFFVTAEKPKLGLVMTLIAGFANMILDAVLVGLAGWGLVGAAIATAFSQLLGGIVPIIYFARPNSSALGLVKTDLNMRALRQAAFNGSSELLSNISMSVVGMLYNIQLIKCAGEDGVAAYGVLMYVNFIFISAFIGYCVGSAPIIGFKYGAADYKQLKGMLKKSIVIIGGFSVVMLVTGELLGAPLSKLFVGYDQGLFEMTRDAFRIFSLSFLFAGFAIFGSSFFTALNNGPVSALISFLRTMVFQIAAVLVFPVFWGIDGIWWSVVAAEVLAVAVTVILILALKKKYKY